MADYAPPNGTATVPAGGTSVSVANADLTTITAGMNLYLGSRLVKSGDGYKIAAVTRTGTTGGTITTLAPVPGGYTSAEFMVDVMGGLPPDPTVYNASVLTRVLVALQEFLGDGTNLTSGSKQLVLNRAAGSGSFSQVVRALAGRKWFGEEHRTVGGIEQYVIGAYPDGTSRVDSVLVNGATGGVKTLSAEGSVASAATTDLSAPGTDRVLITGTTTITSFGSAKWQKLLIRFGNSLTLTHNAPSLVLPAGANMVMGAGDRAIVVSDGSGNWTLAVHWPATAQTVNARDLGAVGNGVADDFTAIQRALVTLGGDVRVPRGTYRVVLPNGNGLGSIPAGTIIQGAGRDLTKIVFECSTATYLNVISLAAGKIAFRNIWLHFQLVDSQTATFFLLPASQGGLQFEKCRLTANTQIVNGVKTNSSYLWNVSGNYDDVVVDDCEISNWYYTKLKTNESTAANRRWRFRDNTFRDNVTSHLSINSPNGVWDDLTISGNTFGDQAGLGAGVGHMVALASVTNAVVGGNTFKGVTDGEAVHIEEACDTVSVSDNTIEVTSPFATWGYGVRVLDNNIAGAYVRPKNIVVADNVLRRTGTVDGIGLDVTYDATGTGGGERVSFTGNTVIGFAKGIATSEGCQGCRVTDNTVSACTIAINAYDASPAVEHNTIENCGTGISSTIGGLFGKNKFVDTPIIAASGVGRTSLSGYTQRVSGSRSGAAATYAFNLGRLPNRFNGRAKVFVGANESVNQQTALVDMTFNGTAITQTVTLVHSGGGYADMGTAPFGIITGPPLDLKFSAYFGTTATVPVRLQMEFDGLVSF